MLCQSCGQRQATCHFAINQNGLGSEAHLCADCAGHYAGQYRQLLAGMFPLGNALAFAGLPPQEAEGAAGGWAAWPAPATQPVTAAGDPQFQRRRELELLQRKLRDAVAGEDYEQAVGLRDEIRRLERENGGTDLLLGKNAGTERNDEQ